MKTCVRIHLLAAMVVLAAGGLAGCIDDSTTDVPSVDNPTTAAPTTTTTETPTSTTTGDDVGEVVAYDPCQRCVDNMIACETHCEDQYDACRASCGSNCLNVFTQCLFSCDARYDKCIQRDC